MRVTFCHTFLVRSLSDGIDEYRTMRGEGRGVMNRGGERRDEERRGEMRRDEERRGKER